MTNFKYFKIAIKNAKTFHCQALMNDHTFYIIEDDFAELEKITEEPLLFEAAWILQSDIKVVWLLSSSATEFDFLEVESPEWGTGWAPAPHFGGYPYYHNLRFRIAHKMRKNPELSKEALPTIEKIIKFYKERIPFFESPKFVKNQYGMLESDWNSYQESWKEE